MYDKNQIDDSLAFVNQIKDLQAKEGNDFTPSESSVSEELFASLASLNQAERPWESILSETSSPKDQEQENKRRQYEEELKEQALAQARANAEASMKQRLEIEAKIRAQEEARIREQIRKEAEEKVRAQMEEEQKAKERLQEEARKKIEEEIRRKAEEEARRKAEEEARQKAEEEARQKAQEEARKKIEEEIRRKAEEEARQKIQEEARRKAEEEARKKAEEERQKDEEILRLQQRISDLQKEAEIAALEAKVKELENKNLSIQNPTNQVSPVDASSTTGLPTPIFNLNPGMQNTAAAPLTEQQKPQAKPMPVFMTDAITDVSTDSSSMTKETIDEIFAQELAKSKEQEANEKQQRKQRFQQQIEKQKKKLLKKKDGSFSNTSESSNAVDLLKEHAGGFLEKGKTLIEKIQYTIDDKLTDPDTKEQREKGKMIGSYVVIFLVSILAAYLISTFVTHYIAHPTTIEGESMKTTFSNGDTVLIQNLAYKFKSPKRYDVVVFPVPVDSSETYYIKRVIGMPGETIQIKDGKVYIDDKLLESDTYGYEDYIYDAGYAQEPVELGEDEYFVLGDNRNSSTDSRSSTVGIVHKRSIVGKAWGIISPFSKFGSIYS